MSRIPWRDHVVVAGDLHHGEPCIKGTRIPVRTVIGSLADGMTPEEIRAAYPQLAVKDIFGALSYAADVLRHEVLLLGDKGAPCRTRGSPCPCEQGRTSALQH
jgi:uncharacterized protein (DUF433 family)